MVNKAGGDDKCQGFGLVKILLMRTDIKNV